MSVIGTILIILAIGGIFHLVRHLLKRLGLRGKMKDYENEDFREMQIRIHGGDASRTGMPLEMDGDK